MENNIKVLMYSREFDNIIAESVSNILKGLSLKVDCDIGNFVLICPKNLSGFKEFMKSEHLSVKAYDPNRLMEAIKFVNYCIFYKSSDMSESEEFLFEEAKDVANRYNVPFVVEIY